MFLWCGGSETNRNTAHGTDSYNQEWSVQTSAVDVEITSNVSVDYTEQIIMISMRSTFCVVCVCVCVCAGDWCLSW